MKKTIWSILIGGVMFSILNAYAPKQTPLDTSELEARSRAVTLSEPSYAQATNPGGNSEAYKIASRHIRANFRNASVYYAVKQVARSLRIPFDSSFIPSSPETLTMKFRGTLGEFLDQVYMQTGVKYKYRNGVLSVFNKDEVNRGYVVRKCGKGKKKISIKLKNVPPLNVFEYFMDKFGYVFSFDTKYVDLSGQGVNGKTPMSSTTFYYRGCDPREALINFARENDLALIFKSNKRVKVVDHLVTQLDLPAHFNIDFNNAQASGSGGEGSAGGTSTSSMKEDYRDEFQKYIGQFLSSHGKVYTSMRGYITIEDRPSYVRRAKRLIRTEMKHQIPIGLSVSIIRVDLSDKYGMGVDWSAALRGLGKALHIQNLRVGLNYASRVEGGLAVSGVAAGMDQVLKILGEYGNAKIVHQVNTKARVGIMSSIRYIEEIPYMETSKVPSDNGQYEISAESKTKNAGIILNILPTVTRGEIVNLDTAITVSEYLGDKTFNIDNSEYVVPKLASNDLHIPARVQMGESIVLSGFKVLRASDDQEGIPILSKIPVIGGLFGYNGTKKGTSEFLVIITPRKILDY
jgi:type II secretory pathway component GspD/PulD (secretin)